jgi:hypothetical protein
MLTPFGEYKSACFSSDYYNGVKANPNRVPPGPENSEGLIPWFYDIWERDFVKMKSLGVNTLRVYNFNLITSTLIKMFPNLYNVSYPNAAAQHLQFMDFAEKYGFKVIAPIIQDESFLLSSTSEQLDKHIEASVTSLGNHPALLMWCLGNEMSLMTNPQLLQLVNEKMETIRETMIKIHNRSVPVRTAVVDDPTTYNFLVANLKVDVFTSNAGYRFVYMDPLWSGQGNFPGWTNISLTHNLPFLIGEFGTPQNGDQVTLAMPDWFNRQWMQIVQHIVDGTIGGVFFEYNDEVEKQGEQAHMGAVSFIPANVSGGLSSLDPNVWVPDIVVEKKYIFQAIKEGINNSIYKEYNYNADVFKLIGRQPVKLPGFSAEVSHTMKEEPIFTLEITKSISASSSLAFNFMFAFLSIAISIAFLLNLISCH